MHKQNNTTATLDLYVELNNKLSMGKLYCVCACQVFFFQSGNKFHRLTLQHVGEIILFALNLLPGNFI